MYKKSLWKLKSNTVLNIFSLNIKYSRLAGPNTGLGWISEGRRRVPLLPRGVPQTAYTEIADKAAEMAAAENKEILKRLEAEMLVAPKSNEEELPNAEGQIAEGALASNESMDELLYPPVAMEDQSTKVSNLNKKSNHNNVTWFCLILCISYSKLKIL